MIAKHAWASFLSSLPAQAQKSDQIKKLLVLIHTCVLYASSEEIFERTIYQRCHIKSAMMGHSKTEDLISYGTLIVDSQTVQTDVFAKDEPRSPGVLREPGDKKD